MGSPPGCGELRAMVKPPLPWLKPQLLPQDLLLSPSRGRRGRPPPSHAPFSVFDPEGWRERPIRGLGQISILSWKLRIQSVHTHLRPQISPLQPGEFAELSGHPPSISIQTDTVGTECKSYRSYFLSICGVGAGRLEAICRGAGDGSPERLGPDFSFPSTHLLCGPGVWGSLERLEGVSPSPFPLLCHSPFQSVSSLLPLLPTLSLDNRRDSPGRGGTASSALPRVQNAESAKRLLDRVLNENAAPSPFISKHL